MKYNFWDNLMETDEHAGGYMVSYGEGPGSMTRIMLGSFINNGESVLDVGCGPGWNMDQFAQFGPALSKYKGVDYSIRFVRAANKRLNEEHVQNFTTAEILPFEQQDCRDLKEEDNSWDVVIIQDCLEHTNGYVKPINEAMRIATKRVILCFWRPFNINGQDDINDDGDDGYGATYDKAKFESFIESFGFGIHETETPPDANRWHKYYIIDKEEPR